MYYYIYKEGLGSLVELEVYFEDKNDNRIRPEVRWLFSISTIGSYKIAKSMGDKDIEFLNELADMKYDFYEWAAAEVNKKNIKRFFNEGDWDTYHKSERAIYDYWVSKFKEFCKKWDLNLSQD